MTHGAVPPHLDQLTDAQLHALLVAVQTLLLDHPNAGPSLVVDVLTDDEAHVLALYRALRGPAPRARGDGAGAGADPARRTGGRRPLRVVTPQGRGKETPIATRIVVIDDDPAIQTLLRELRSDERSEPHVFGEGVAAYPCVRELATAAIILDLRLEDRMRRDPVLQATPIIVCSADLRALEVHAGDQGHQWHAILAKPCEIADLLALVQQVVGRSG